MIFIFIYRYNIEKSREQVFSFLFFRKWPLKESIQLAIRSTILNCWYIFQIFGALIAPTITERYGRKSESYNVMVFFKAKR